jgi:hypothetical protein
MKCMIRKILSGFLMSVMLILLPGVYAFADFSGFANINYSKTTDNDEAGEETDANLSQNYYLMLSRNITSNITYTLNLRSSLNDGSVTDVNGIKTSSYRRDIEPQLDINLINPIYNFNVGYRRLERWTTASLSDDSRTTDEFYYTRFDLRPIDLPDLTLQADRRNEFDYLSPRITDRTQTTYYGRSGYQYNSMGFTGGYILSYTDREEETPAQQISKTTSHDLSGIYNLGYAGILTDINTNFSINYRANYTRNESRVFSEQTQNVLLRRNAIGGFRAKGSFPPASAVYDIPSTFEPRLINQDFITGIPEININNIGDPGRYHNIGVEVSSAQAVESLFIYVNRDVTSDVNLRNPANWQVFMSNFNAVGTWTQISVMSVTVSVYDLANTIYRYELHFSAPQNAAFFKAVNLQTVSLVGLPDVLVTEIEAYGTEQLKEGSNDTVFESFTQGVDLNVGYRPSETLAFNFSYFINRADQSPVSVPNSTEGVFKNIFSKSIDVDNGMRSNVSRSYNLGATWLTHQLLTTSVRLSRNELFDDSNTTDFSSNNYMLSFASSPLPTLDTSLTLQMNESFSFGEKQYTSYSAAASIGSKLYRDVNMVTDFGYTQTRGYIADIRTSIEYINGSLNAELTPKLSGNVVYSFNWTDTDDESFNSQEGGLLLTYRPGRFINLTGNVRMANQNGDSALNWGFLLDWLPMTAVRLNLNYQHLKSDPGPSVAETFGSYVQWKITRFMDAQLSYNYAKVSNDINTKSHTVSGNLNCRF